MDTFENFKNQLKKLYKEIENKNLRLTDFVNYVMDDKGYLMERFYLCLVGNHTIMYYKADQGDFECANDRIAVDISQKEQLDAYIKKSMNLEENTITLCNNITGLADEQEAMYQAYYWASVKGIDELNPMYLTILNKVYKEWVTECFYWNAVIEDTKMELEKMRIRAEETFGKELKLQFGIDLNVINEIAGTYYESKDCHAVMSFDLTGALAEYTVELDETVSLKEENIRLCRKLLQMVQPKQSLFIRRMDDKVKTGEWKIVGIGTIENNSQSIRFTIKSHMNWEMEINGQTVVCYKCGKYMIENKRHKVKEFSICYKHVFHKTCPADIEDLMAKAFAMNHGMAILFIDDAMMGSFADESGFRYYEETVGFGEKTKRPLNEARLENLSAIDGTILLNPLGECLKFGMILNSSEMKVGKKERGSRYNSVKNYIANCKDKVNALGVVISEDKTIDIICNIDAIGKGENYE